MLNVSNSTVFHWAQKGFTPDGIQCRYEDETRKLTFEKHNSGWKNKKPIIVNGTWYGSKAEAEEALGFKPGYLTPYLNGTRKNTKYICRYRQRRGTDYTEIFFYIFGNRLHNKSDKRST